MRVQLDEPLISYLIYGAGLITGAWLGDGSPQYILGVAIGFLSVIVVGPVSKYVDKLMGINKDG